MQKFEEWIFSPTLRLFGSQSNHDSSSSFFIFIFFLFISNAYCTQISREILSERTLSWGRKDARNFRMWIRFPKWTTYTRLACSHERLPYSSILEYVVYFRISAAASRRCWTAIAVTRTPRPRNRPPLAAPLELALFSSKHSHHPSSQLGLMQQCFQLTLFQAFSSSVAFTLCTINISFRRQSRAALFSLRPVISVSFCTPLCYGRRRKEGQGGTRKDKFHKSDIIHCGVIGFPDRATPKMSSRHSCGG